MKLATRSRNGATRSKVRRMWRQGRSARDIAKKLEISTQAVYKHLKRIEEEDGQR